MSPMVDRIQCLIDVTDHQIHDQFSQFVGVNYTNLIHNSTLFERSRVKDQSDLNSMFIGLSRH